MLTHVIAKTLVFNERGELLVLTCSANDTHRPGGLDLPGGKIEAGEEVVVGAAREADEEAGLRIEPEDLRWLYADTNPAYNIDAKEMVNMVRVTFGVRVLQPQVRLSHEHDAFAWHGIDEAMELFAGTRYQAILDHMLENEVAVDLWRTDG